MTVITEQGSSKLDLISPILATKLVRNLTHLEAKIMHSDMNKIPIFCKIQIWHSEQFHNHSNYKFCPRV